MEAGLKLKAKLPLTFTHFQSMNPSCFVGENLLFHQHNRWFGRGNLPKWHQFSNIIGHIFRGSSLQPGRCEQKKISGVQAKGLRDEKLQK